MDDYMPSRYQPLGRIGEGVHGVVVKARDLQADDKIVAIKKLSLRTKFGVVSLNTVREIRALQHCRCDNVLELLDMYPDLAGISLVFEYMPHTLHSKLRDEENPLSRASVRRYTAMLLRGLAYLHRLRLMHRDVKPANLLIDRHDVLKIADFGLARIYADGQPDKLYSPQVATRWYRAPEILWGCQRYGPPVDLWASGAVFAEMLRGVPLFAGATDIEQLALVVRTLGTPNLKDWPEVRSLPDYNKIRFPNARGERWEDIFPSCTTRDELGLVDGLVRYNPAKRLTADEAPFGVDFTAYRCYNMPPPTGHHQRWPCSKFLIPFENKLRREVYGTGFEHDQTTPQCIFIIKPGTESQNFLALTHYYPGAGKQTHQATRL